MYKIKKIENTRNAEIIEYNGKEKKIIIPEIIEGMIIVSIAKNVFRGKHIESLNLPKTLEIIEEGAFANNNLKEVHIPEGVKFIGGSGSEELNNPWSEFTHYVHNGAFSNNVLNKIFLPFSLEIIGAHAFAENKIREVEIPKSVKKIDEVAFFRNEIQTVIISEAVLEIGFDAFRSQNRKLNRVIILGDQKRFNEYWSSIGFPKKTLLK